MSAWNASNRMAPKLVLADGTFDPLHAGHVQYLLSARHYGSRLLVRVAPGADILAKGRTPFQTHVERLFVVQQLRCVDEVCAHDTLASAIRRRRPAYLVKGADWTGRLPADVLVACAETGTIMMFTHTQAKSSTERLRA